MKASVNGEFKNVEGIKFPKIMQYYEGGLVVLFWDDSEGVVLYNKDDSWKTGAYSNDWAMDEFITFDGSVTISND